MPKSEAARVNVIASRYRFITRSNQIPALRFSALLNEEAPEVELMLA